MCHAGTALTPNGGRSDDTSQHNDKRSVSSALSQVFFFFVLCCSRTVPVHYLASVLTV